MFVAGQKVWHRDGRRSGTVLECDGERVYIEQDNGAELDFPASELSATEPGAAPSSGRQPTVVVVSAARPGDSRDAGRPAAYVIQSRTLTSRDITPEHVRVLGVVPVRTLQAIIAVYERRPGGRKFSTLDVAGKLNAIAEITAVPYRTMRDYSDRPGELSLLMGKGLADSRKSG
jgi:hypothetical protein